MSRWPALLVFPATVWLDPDHARRLGACPECFEALHAANFYRVSAPISGDRTRPERCDVCRVKRHKGLRDPWRIKRRREYIAALHAGLQELGAGTATQEE